MTDRRVLAGGLVLAAGMVTGGSVMWPALAMVVVGLALAVVGLAVLTGRGRRSSDPPHRADPEHPDAAAPVDTEPLRDPVPAPTSQPAVRPVPASVSPRPPESETGSSPSAGSPDTSDGAASVARSEGSITDRGEDHVADIHDGPCDWEFRVDVGEGDPVVIREAVGRRCCVHVLHVRSLDAVAAPSERADRTWSGDRTRIGPSRAVSDVRTDSRRVRPEARGLALSLDATLARQEERPVVTSVDDADLDGSDHTSAERLWEAHLARLDEAGVVNDSEEGPLRLQTATRYRTEVALRTTRGCRAGGHRVDATADVSVDVEGEAAPAGGTRLTLPHVSGWVEGDLQVAATEQTRVLPGTEVHAAPGIDDGLGLSVGAAPGADEIRGSFAGHVEGRFVDRDVELLVASAVVADIGLGEAGGPPAALVRVTVGVEHRIGLVVASHTADAGADESDPSDLECTCTPAYEVRFGGGPEGAAAHSGPHAGIRVDGRDFRLEADARPGTDQVPSWTVTSETDHDEASRGLTG